MHDDVTVIHEDPQGILTAFHTHGVDTITG
jgi:hypothetical protein